MKYLKNYDKIIEFIVTLVMGVTICLAAFGLVYLSTIFRD